VPCSLIGVDGRYRGAYCHHTGAPLKRPSTPTRLHGAISHKVLIFIFAAIRTLNLARRRCTALISAGSGIDWFWFFAQNARGHVYPPVRVASKQRISMKFDNRTSKSFQPTGSYRPITIPTLEGALTTPSRRMKSSSMLGMLW
jgi:hypothetical protein